MKEKSLKHLNRTELLELLLVQTKENERLRDKLEKTEAELNDKYLKLQEAGNLANAVMQMNGVMEAVQNAAKQYLYNIKRMEDETRLKCKKMLEDAEKEAKLIRSAAAQKEDFDKETREEEKPEMQKEAETSENNDEMIG